MTTVIVGILASSFVQGQGLSDPEKLAQWQARYPAVDFVKSCEALTRANPTAPELQACESATTEFVAKSDDSSSTALKAFAYLTLGWIAMQRQNWPEAQNSLGHSLELDPNNGQVNYLMGRALALEKQGTQIPLALFYSARAAILDGPDALSDEARGQALAYVRMQYKNFHGSEDGVTSLLEAAKSPRPPSDLSSWLTPPQTGDVFEDPGFGDPAIALWKTLKAALRDTGGRDYFNSGMKDALVPTLKGSVVKFDPETNPTMILLSMEDGAPAEVTLRLEVPMQDKITTGTMLSFEGVAESFTTNPFMVVFRVERGNLHL